MPAAHSLAACTPVASEHARRDHKLLKRRSLKDPGSQELRRAIGDALREMRARHGHSQESLARYIPCDRSQITRVEMGRHNPSYAWLDRIMHALGENMARFARLVDKYRH